MAGKFIVQRNTCGLLLLSGLAACAGSSPRVDNLRESAQYQQEARRNYAPPGPASDPWGPYIVEAATRFDVPQRWIRKVMQMESGGHEYLDGQLTTSSAGAMGLMQVEPETYDELRTQYGLGSDPYDPHDNILAGAAYLRELYDQFGTPGFLAAYDAGPGRFSNYIAGNASLPDETRHYVAVLGPEIEGAMPINRSPSDQLAYNDGAFAIATGRRRRHQDVELASDDTEAPHPTRVSPQPVQVAELAAPLPPDPPNRAVAELRRSHGFSLISSAYADTLPEQASRGGAPDWAIQVGAYADRAMARTAALRVREEQPQRLDRATARVGTVLHGDHTLFRARLVGLTRAEAEEACDRLSRDGRSCILVSPMNNT